MTAPLPKDVGEALANYIRRDRRTTSRALFVTHRAPHVAFADAQIVNSVLQDAFERTKLKQRATLAPISCGTVSRPTWFGGVLPLPRLATCFAIATAARQ